MSTIERISGLSERTISKWDSSIPSFDKVEKVINTFNSLYGLTYDEFMGKESPHKEDAKVVIAQLKRDTELFNEYISKKLDEISSDDFDSSEHEIVILEIAKDLYEWLTVSAEYIGESVDLFIRRAAYERAALECASSYEEAVLKLEEKRKERQAKLDKMEKHTEVIGGKEVTVYTSGQSPAGGQSTRKK